MFPSMNTYFPTLTLLVNLGLTILVLLQTNLESNCPLHPPLSLFTLLHLTYLLILILLLLILLFILQIILHPLTVQIQFLYPYLLVHPLECLTSHLTCSTMYALSLPAQIHLLKVFHIPSQTPYLIPVY